MRCNLSTNTAIAKLDVRATCDARTFHRLNISSVLMPLRGLFKDGWHNALINAPKREAEFHVMYQSEIVSMKGIWLVLLMLLHPSLTAKEINVGSGSFKIRGGEGRSDNEIIVYFHVPRTWRKDSQVLIVIPGAGRNAWSYRDAWVAESHKRGMSSLPQLL